MSGTTAAALADRFAIETQVGRGAFGDVFRGRDRVTGHPVAIKRLHGRTNDGLAVDVSRVTIYRWLTGQRRPSGAAAARFALFLDELVAEGVA